MKIAITGSSGLIGSALVQRLQKQSSSSIFLFDRKKYSLEKTETMKTFVSGKDIIIHLAGETEHDDLFYSTNTLGTKNILDAISRFGKQQAHFVLASSFAVYEEQGTKKKLSEDKTPTHPRNHYGLSKLFAEELAAYYARKNKLHVSILRLANVYGPRQERTSGSLLERIIYAVKNNTTLEIAGDGEQTRDLIFVEDVAQGILQTLKNKKVYGVYNICTGVETSVNRLIQMVEHASGKKIAVRFTHDHFEKGYWIGDVTKARKEIGFLATTSVATGIAKTIESQMSL